MATVCYSRPNKSGSDTLLKEMKGLSAAPLPSGGEAPKTSPETDGQLPPRHLIRQFDKERALRDAQEAGLLDASPPPPRRTNPTPQTISLATVYVAAMFANTEKQMSNEERIAKISEVASFYSEPQRIERFKALVHALTHS